MPDTPRRIQLSRRAGWRMPEGAVKVDRSTRWGNPFVVGESIKCGSELWPYIAPMLGPDIPGMPLSAVSFRRPEDVVCAYSVWIIEQPHLMARLVSGELRGHDLACWCPLRRVCHADITLALANDWDEPPEPTRALFAEVADA